MDDDTRVLPPDPDVPRYQGRPVIDPALDTEPAPGDARRRNTVLLVALALVVCGLGATLAVGALSGGGSSQPDDPAAAVGSVTATASPSAAVPDAIAFTSPTGNIGCQLSGTGARCDVREQSWDLPPAPESCDGDWGVGMFVDAERAGLVCATDTVLGEGEALEYGSSHERGSFRCSSARDGMRCEDTASGRGFTVARAAYTSF